jgi:Spy/CpxP family protein refolding chaperone
MNKLTFLSIVTILLLVSNILLVVFINFRKPSPPMHRGPHQGPRNEMIEILKLDNQQITQLDSLIQIHRNSVDSKMEKITEAKQELYNSLKTEISDSLENALLDTITNEFKQLEKLHLAHFKDIKKICKPEQMNNYNELTGKLAKMFSRKPPHRP